MRQEALDVNVTIVIVANNKTLCNDKSVCKKRIYQAILS